MIKTSIGFFLILVSVVTFTTSQTVWEALNSQTERPLFDIHFGDNLNGFACGEDIILCTTNGGLSWDSISSSNGQTLKAIMFNGNLGYTAGSFTLLGTSNGGVSWRGVGTLPATGYWCDVQMVGNDIFLLGGGSIFKYYGSNDQWVAQYSNYRSIEKMFSFNTDTAFACGSEGKIYSTVNGGNNWNITSTNPPAHWKDIIFTSEETAFSCGEGYIIKSSDGGRSWELVHNLPAENFHSLSHCNNIIYACGDNGTIVMSSNSGEDWELSVSGTVNNLYGSYAIDSTVYIVGENGTILRSNHLTSQSSNNAALPLSYYLEQNYPNPFNPSTNIAYSLPRQSMVTIIVYDCSGKEMATIVNGTKAPGKHEASFDASGLSSGVYFYKLSAGDFSDTKKMILLR